MEFTTIIFIVILAIMVIVGISISKKIQDLIRDRRSIQDEPSFDEHHHETDQFTKTSWKIDYKKVALGDVCGVGNFGKTYKGRWRGLSIAVKEMTCENVDEDMIQENLSQIITVRHPDLVLLLGIALPDHDKLWVVTHYMERGNLHTLLADITVELGWCQRVTIALQIARAMTYLHNLDPPILHQNLNPINILVDRKLQAKVNDYGLEPLRKRARQGGLMSQPMWIGPEVFQTGEHEAGSDVYSFGVVLWQLLTRATPYDGQINFANNVKFIKDVTNGLRPDIPKHTPPEMAELIQECWQDDAKARPSFSQIVKRLEGMQADKIDCSLFTQLGINIENEAAAAAETKGWKNETATKKAWMIAYDELKLGKVIGMGGFGKVYAGTFRGSKVAVKKLSNKKSTHKKLLQSKSSFKEFVHELNIMCSLRHPNIVLFIGACLEDGHMCMVMEFCSMGNLFNLLHDNTVRIDYNKIIKILTEIAEGVMYLHSSKPPILHRDLKSLNVLLDDDWNAKVSDFGLTDFKPDNETSQSLMLGSPFWLAPEAMEEQVFTEKSDVYSFGVVAWEMFTRKVPFNDMDQHQAALAIISEDKRPEIPAFVPPDFRDLITSCWDRDPDRRPSFPEVKQSLADLEAKGLPRIELTTKNARFYRKKTNVIAFQSNDAVICYKKYGTLQSRKGDWVLIGPGDDVYTCDNLIFSRTYRQVDPNRPHVFRKNTRILAKEMEEAFLMKTREGMEHGEAGDFLAQNPIHGEQWPIGRESFLNMYEMAPDQSMPDVKKEIGDDPYYGVDPDKGTTIPMLSLSTDNATASRSANKRNNHKDSNQNGGSLGFGASGSDDAGLDDDLDAKTLLLRPNVRRR